MSRGRPRIHASRLMIGVGRNMTRTEQKAVWEELLKFYNGEPPEEMLGQLDDAYASYLADEDAWGEGKWVGIGEEVKDAIAIGRECGALARALPTLESPDKWPQALCTRLRDRIDQFPPTVDAALHSAGIDIWPWLERVRAFVMHPAQWSEWPDPEGDLLNLAAACERMPDMERSRAPLMELRTKRPLIARNRFRNRIIAIQEPHPFPSQSKGEVNDLVRDLFGTLGIKAP